MSKTKKTKINNNLSIYVAKRRMRNKSIKTRISTMTKEFRKMCHESVVNDNISASFIKVQSIINSGVSFGVLHKKTAARRTSKLAIAVNKKIGITTAK